MTDLRSIQLSARSRLSQTGALRLWVKPPRLAASRLAAYGVAAFGFVTAGFAADIHAVQLAQANRCAIYGSGFVTTTDGGCARIGGRVRVQRRVDQRTPIAAPPAAMGVPMGMPMTNGFQFSGGQRDGPNRAHLRLPSETNNVFAPAFR